MNTTKNQIVSMIITLLILLISSGCSDVTVDPDVNISGPDLSNYSKVKACKSFSHSVDITSQTLLTVEGINGTIGIESVSNTDQVTISGEKIVSADTYKDANSHLKDIFIEINTLTNELISYSVDYNIKIPSGLSVIVKNVNGMINGKVSVPLNGSIDMNLQNGSIDIEIPQNTSAALSANLVNGIISVQNLIVKNKVTTSKSLEGLLKDGQGTITLKTVNGKINVSGF